MFPKILHQTYPWRELPQPLQENALCLQAANPAWEYRFYDDDDMVGFIDEAYGGEILSSFLRLNPEYGAARSDLFRYLLLYRYGGIYLDMKSSFSRPIDEVLREDDRYILCQWDNQPGQRHRGYGLHRELSGLPGGEFQQWHVIAAPGHPFLKAVIEAVLANIRLYCPRAHGVGWRGVLRTTGPIAYTIAINRVLGLHPHRIATNEEFGLEYTVPGKTDRHRGVVGKRHYSTLETGIVLPRPSFLHEHHSC